MEMKLIFLLSLLTHGCFGYSVKVKAFHFFCCLMILEVGHNSSAQCGHISTNRVQNERDVKLSASTTS